MKKRIPDRWSQQYKSVSSQHASPLKRAIEEIAALEAERAKLHEDKDLLGPTLKDLQDCRKLTYEMAKRTHKLEEMLHQCREALAKRDR